MCDRVHGMGRVEAHPAHRVGLNEASHVRKRVRCPSALRVYDRPDWVPVHFGIVLECTYMQGTCAMTCGQLEPEHPTWAAWVSSFFRCSHRSKYLNQNEAMQGPRHRYKCKGKTPVKASSGKFLVTAVADGTEPSKVDLFRIEQCQRHYRSTTS